jgi:dTDP-L-rhamnose 4-epimerase
MRMLVIGGVGFIGSHLVEAPATGDRVRVVDALPPAAHGSERQPIVPGHVRDEAAVEEALSGVGVVCRQAATVIPSRAHR